MGYVLGVILFLGIIGLYIVKTCAMGVATITRWCQSGVYKDFSTKHISVTAESSAIRRIQTDAGLGTILKEVSTRLSSYAYFNYGNLLKYRRETQEDIAIEYLLSKQGLTSRKMAEFGCYRIPEESTADMRNAMVAYMKLLQENIKNSAGTSMQIIEEHWLGNESWGNTRNFIWSGSPADKSWWDAGKNITSGYKCVYRKNSP